MSTPKRETVLDELLANLDAPGAPQYAETLISSFAHEMTNAYGASEYAKMLVSSFAHKLTDAELVAWVVRNEFIADPDKNEAAEELVLDFEVGAEVEVHLTNGTWRHAKVSQVEHSYSDDQLSYRATLPDSAYDMWYCPIEVRARS